MTVPNSAPISREAEIAANGCTPFPTKDAIRILVNATTAPTDRSMPPERMTNVAPTAATPRKALSPTRFTPTRSEPKFGNEIQPTA